MLKEISKFALSDQDDIWLPTKVEELLNAIGDHWLVFSNSRLINEDDEQIDGGLVQYAHYLFFDEPFAIEARQYNRNFTIIH